MKRIMFILTYLCLCVCAEAKFDLTIPEDLTVRCSHPRLFINDKEFSELKKTVNWGYNKALVKMHESYMELAESSVADNKTFKMDLSGKVKSQLQVSRNVLRELGALSYAYRFTKNRKYLERASAILENVCSFESWNPGHHLDVAEMAVAVSLAYDWLYGKLPHDVRSKCEAVIETHLFEASDVPRYRRRYLAHNNWGQVLNCGLLCGAIAFYDKNPEKCKEYIRRVVTDNASTIEFNYAPDGIYPEGPTYWGYGTNFQILLNTALIGVYGSDFGLSKAEGFEKSSRFVTFSAGNLGMSFNYSDSREKRFSIPGLWYFAHQFNNPDLAYNEMKAVIDKKNYKFTDRTGFIHIYYASKCPVDDVLPLNESVFYGHGPNPLVMARTGWKKKDIYLGAKGGGAKNSHSHLDAGSFVYEAYGVRWASEPPYPGKYETTENALKTLNASLWDMSQKSFRWKQYGYNNAHHNTLTINGKDHDCEGVATLVEVYDSGDRKGGRFDLSSIFPHDVRSAERTVCIMKDEYLEVTDKITALDSLDAHVRWNMTTEAEVKITDEGIILSVGERKMLLHSEGAPVSYTTDMNMPADVPEVLLPFYENDRKYAGFTFVIPAGKTMTVTTTLKRN